MHGAQSGADTRRGQAKGPGADSGALSWLVTIATATPTSTATAATATIATATSTSAPTTAATSITTTAATTGAAATLTPGWLSRRVQADNTRRFRTLRLLDDVELDFLALVEDLEAGAVNGAVVNEHVRAALPLEKAVALLLRKPFDGTVGTSHRCELLD